MRGAITLVLLLLPFPLGYLIDKYVGMGDAHWLVRWLVGLVVVALGVMAWSVAGWLLEGNR